MRKTNEQLQKEVTELEVQVASLQDNQAKVRKTLSSILGSYRFIGHRFGTSEEKEIVVLDWVGIAFEIGKLKANADSYKITEENKDLGQQVEKLKQLINDFDGNDR